MSERLGNVLVLSAGRRVQLVRLFQRALADLKIGGKVMTTDSNPEWSPASRLSDASFRAPRVTAPEYESFLFDLVRREGIQVVIPVLDTGLLRLAEIRDQFSKLGCTAVVSDAALVATCRDKRASSEWFRTLDCESPRLLNPDSLTFPCFVKPFDGSMSKGARALLSPDMVSPDIFKDPGLMFMEYLSPEEYDEFTIDAYYDRSGTLRCLVPRKRVEVRGGEISKGLTLRGKTYDYLLPRLAKVRGARGCLTFQFFVSKKEDRWVASELNPRFGGGIPLSAAAGANYPEWIIREYLLGQSIADFDGWKDRLAMVRYDDEVVFTADGRA